ncbi:hypothetical protein EHQ12_01065 [Leptospira gomenensis]|uniref:Uncharacterized protein n=1 Tax=Leptospira gomenensis TaxID=2484974 RepID=A0A5F1Z1D6_9LEPT|nr:hypothetical protein [Leptospira gomenensis]TGK29050.1 hypothetical protein EHQ17_16990 [Leptospira gomenensis]TGK45017.1 hypothetical protein EHQ12_01065 [Leptospira gomenensis]TGK51847.1 hypothetical protein EHQ07_01540 [Leptospira gomenensis]TGK67345.1 hypothetical protein EHQ13_02530 [Leptospira gomenensis]
MKNQTLRMFPTLLLGILFFFHCSFLQTRERAVEAWRQSVSQIERSGESGSAKRIEAERNFHSQLESNRNLSDEIQDYLRTLILVESSRKFNFYVGKQNWEKAALIAELFDSSTNYFGIGDAVVEGIKTGVSYSAREYFAADLIAYTTQSKDTRFLPLIERMVPNPISDARLAFNLSCLHALHGNKKEMLQYMKIAIFLGKPTVDFETDQDFHGFRSDPDFIRTLLWGGPALDPALIPPATEVPRGNSHPGSVPTR